jgi:hypothetical protein
MVSEKQPKNAIFIEFRIIQIPNRVNLGCLISQGCFDESRHFLLTSDTDLSARFTHQIYPPDVWRASAGAFFRRDNRIILSILSGRCRFLIPFQFAMAKNLGYKSGTD